MGLTLSRFVGEEVVVKVGGEMLVIQVAGVDRGKVRLKFKGPRSIIVHRREIADKIAEWEAPLGQLLAVDAEEKEPVKRPA